MSTTVQHESAKIYTFPNRARLGKDSVADQTNSVVSLASRRVANVAFGSGWYHEAAIAEEAGQDVKRRT